VETTCCHLGTAGRCYTVAKYCPTVGRLVLEHLLPVASFKYCWAVTPRSTVQSRPWQAVCSIFEASGSLRALAGLKPF
jgi:hypothetical protein